MGKKGGVLMLLFLLAALEGCSARPLSEREIVRAAFFCGAGRQSSVILLLEDAQGGEEGESFKTAEGHGTGPAQALAAAEQSLAGTAFYGLMDVVGLPAGCDWAQTREIGELLYTQAKPTPELSLFLLLGDETAGNAAGLYQELQAAQARYRIHCGLQQLFVQEDLCAVPARREQGYGFALLARQGPAKVFSGDLPAQLAAVLCGQSGCFLCPYAGGNAFCRANASVTVGPEQDAMTVCLHLKDAETQCLNTALLPQQSTARAVLRAELYEAFDELCDAAEAQSSDPLRLAFWDAVHYGPGKRPVTPVLEVVFE